MKDSGSFTGASGCALPQSLPDKIKAVESEVCKMLQSVQWPMPNVEEMFAELEGPKSRLCPFHTYFRANVAELLHHERLNALLQEICFSDPGLGISPADLDTDLTARSLLRGASWPRLLSGYEEFEPSPGWSAFGVMKRRRAPCRWELLLAQHFPLLSWWYSRLIPVEPDAGPGGTMRARFMDLAELDRNKGVQGYESPLAWVIAMGITVSHLCRLNEEWDERVKSDFLFHDLSEVEVKLRSHVGAKQFFFGHEGRRWRRKGDIDGVHSSREDAEAEARAFWRSGNVGQFQRAWLHLNKPEFKSAPGRFKLKLTRTIIARDHSMVLQSLMLGKCWTESLLSDAIKCPTAETGSFRDSHVIGHFAT